MRVPDPSNDILIRKLELINSSYSYFCSFAIIKIESFVLAMANDRADNLGGWTDEPTFAPQGAIVQPDGTINGEEIPLEHRHGDEHNNEPLGDGSQSAIAPNSRRQENGVNPDAGPVIEPVERMHDPTLPLNSRDVCAFIVNKMIGTGIFIQPPAVLLLTQSKVEALFLWVLGFFYTLVR
jgi:hypothetical protein